MSLLGMSPQALLAKIGAALLAAAVIAGFAFYGGVRFESGKLSDLKLGYAQAQTAAVQRAAGLQRAEDQKAEAAAVAEAKAQQKIVVHTLTVKQEIVRHVPVIHACVPYGFVRVLNDAALGRHDAAVAPSASQSDDTCAPVSWDQVASDLTDDYGAGRQNAEQLNALEAAVQAIHAASAAPPTN